MFSLSVFTATLTMLRTIILFLLTSVALSSLPAFAQQPAQEPLLARTQSVRPNLSMMFDDSRSMLYNCNYTANVMNRVAPTYGTLTIGQGCRNTGTFQNTSFSVMNAGNPIYISPSTNELAYSPHKLYRPPFITPTTRAATASVASNFPLAANITGWSGSTSGGWTPTAHIAPTEDFSGATAEPTGTSRVVHLPRAGFDPTTANLAALESFANYDSIAVSADRFYYRAAASPRYTDRGTVNPLPKPLARIDCTANASYCTVAEERQNIANWQRYYRNRLQAFRVGVAEAFTGLPDTFRFNYTTLGQALTTVNTSGNRVYRDSTTSGGVFGGIPSLNNYGAGIGAFYTWLFSDTGNGFNTVAEIGTPLRQAYDRLGQYYLNNTSSNGPWASTPWTANTEAASSHVSCRKSFAILATDGSWNDGNTLASITPTVTAVVLASDIDGNLGPILTASPSGNTFRYTPGATGAWNLGKRDSSSGTAQTLADVAMYYWMNDLRSGANALTNNVSDGSLHGFPFWQSLNLTTVAFGANGSLTEAQLAQARRGERSWPIPAVGSPNNLDDLAHAAHNAGGDFLSVNDAQTFADRLRGKLLDISSEELSQAGVVGSSQALTSGALKIEANYVSGKWWGNVTAVQLDAANARETGVAWRVVEVNTLGAPTGTTTIPTPASREIYSLTSSNVAIEFKHTNLIVAANGMTGSGATRLTSTWTSDQTDFIRGVRTKEGDGQPFRARASIMGDIINSTPVFVKDTTPNAYNNFGTSTQKTEYATYKALKAARTDGLVFVGANDGMLHAFRESNGREVFAYIPRAVLPHLHLLTEKDYAVKHRYYVDGPLNEVDAYIRTPNATGTKTTRWSNVVLGTTGAGAKAVFAIDTTEVSSLRGDDILWEINTDNTSYTNDLGFITQKVQAGVTASGDWVAIFGNGVGSTSGLAKLFVVNLETGALIKSINTDSTTSNGLGGVRLVRNSEGKILGAYAGDSRGRMWRFDLSANFNSSWPNSGQILFTAPATSPTSSTITTTFTPAITAPPAVFGRTDGRPGYIVVFGTGRMLYASDVSTPHPLQRAYGIWDTARFGTTDTFRVADYSNLTPSIISTTSTAGDITNTTFYTAGPAAAINWSTQHGWRMDLNLSDGQRIVYPVEVLEGLVQLQSVAPRAISANACTNDGQARGFNFFLKPDTGGCRTGKTLDTNQDNDVSSADSNACGLSTIGDGTNAIFRKPGLGDGGTGGGGPDVIDFVEPPCNNQLVYSVDTTTNSQLVKTCDVVPPPPSTGGSTSFRRTVRQVFIRP